MLIKFSDSTATLLKTLAFLNELNWSDETKSTLDLTSIRQLKGCRTTLVRDCLKFIQKLDVLAETESDEKNYALATIKALVKALNYYKISCERYPRLKDFLNIIPDNMSGIVGFLIIASTLASIVFPPLAAIPLFIFSGVLMDLFFNNREQAKNFNEILSIFQEELRTIQERKDLLIQTRRSTTTPPLSPITTASTNHSSRMYDTVNQSNNPHTPNMNSPSTNRLAP